jgi:hypothetical protein
MNRETRESAVARRTFLSRLTAGAAAFGAAFGASALPGVAAQSATTAPAAATPFQPARHPEDDWFDQTTGKHRFFQDTTTPDGLGQAMAFARNFLEANASGYKLTDADVAQVICLRHRSTPFAFGDAMWAKYGPMLSERANNFVDPKTKEIPAVNVYEVEGQRGGDNEGGLRNGGVTLTALSKRNVRYAVCSMATRRAATLIAQRTNGKVDEVFAELAAHLVPGGHLVAAGIVAVNRAQERGYSTSSVY